MADDRTWFAVGLLVVALLTGGTVLQGAGASPPANDTQPMTDLETTDDRLWPYTSKSKSFESRTLGINLVVYAPPNVVRRAMADGDEFDWEPTPVNETDADSETHSVDQLVIDDDGVVWQSARGSERYTFITANDSANVTADDSEGTWLREYAQVHDGSYLGARDHVRIYGDDDESWTAMQAHSEHWDWFRLRHSVSGVDNARQRVEGEFMGAQYVDQVSRLYLGNEGPADGDGWVSFVEFATNGPPATAGAFLALFALPQGVRRLRDRYDVDTVGIQGLLADLALVVVPPALYLGVRLGGIAFEGTFPGVSPKLLAGALYPVIAVGIPVSTYVLARRHPPATAFTVALVALGVAFMADYALLGVDVVSLRSVCYRASVLASLGLVAAAGATERHRALTILGASCWVATLITPLYGAL